MGSGRGPQGAQGGRGGGRVQTGGETRRPRRRTGDIDGPIFGLTLRGTLGLVCPQPPRSRVTPHPSDWPGPETGRSKRTGVHSQVHRGHLPDTDRPPPPDRVVHDHGRPRRAGQRKRHHGCRRRRHRDFHHRAPRKLKGHPLRHRFQDV